MVEYSPQNKKNGDDMDNVEGNGGHISSAVIHAGKVWQRASSKNGASAMSLRGESCCHHLTKSRLFRETVSWPAIRHSHSVG